MDIEDNRITSDGAEARAITLVPQEVKKRLNRRQVVDYRDHRERLAQWMLNLGKNPDEAKGYAFETTRVRMSYLNQFFLFVWDEHDGYTTKITQDHADAYMRYLAYDDCSDTYRANTQKGVKMYLRWQGKDWDPQITFTGDTGRSRPRDYFTNEERTALREAVLEYGSVPSYDVLTKDERQEWKVHLAQRFRKPTDDVGREDFQQANGFKIPSLIHTALDAALRPIEVGRARTTWVDLDNQVLRIPIDESSKNRDNWEVALQEQTTRMLDRWMGERKLYDKYDDNDRLWLTRECEPYSSGTLNYLLDKLCDIANIDDEDRSLTFYCIRHSTGTYLSNNKGLEAAAEQLRHQSVETTRKYDNAPVEERRDGLEEMG